jgi:hypothetical protein
VPEQLADDREPKADPKAPSPKTYAFWDIVNASRSPEDAELADVLDGIGNPAVTTLGEIINNAPPDFQEWLKNRKNSRAIPHRLGMPLVTISREDAGQRCPVEKNAPLVAHSTATLRSF